MRVLLIEDDTVLQDVLARSLGAQGFRVDCAGDLAIARHLWMHQRYDAALLDLNLPLGACGSRASGLELLRQMRARGDRTPVLILTARNRTDERIAGLEAGGDDYLGKPFDTDELAARVRAVVRRTQGVQDVLRVGQLQYHRIRQQILIGGDELLLPAREREVLVELLSPPGRTVSKREFAEKLSDFADLLADNALEAFISRLRKKLHGSGASIRTLRGLGYRIEERDS